MAPVVASSLSQRRRRGAQLSIVVDPKSLDDMDIESPELLAAYEFTPEVLGQGTSAIVKRAVRKGGGTGCGFVAVKITPTFKDEELCDAVREEFELLRSCQHPGIVEVYDLFLAPNLTKAYLFMEFAQGSTLQALVDFSSTLSEPVAQPLFAQFFSALAYLHSESVAHRDLKPDNIMVDLDAQRLRICDFNCARRLSNCKLLSTRVGTAAFAAPELLLGCCARGEPLDVWSAGLCLYFAFSGASLQSVIQHRTFASPLEYGKYIATSSAVERAQWLSHLALPSGSSVLVVLSGCLEPNATKRPAAALVLEHAWLSAECNRTSSEHAAEPFGVAASKHS